MKPTPYTLWLTGLSASGKTTLADALAQEFTRRGVPCEVLDGDVLRQKLSADLGFSRADRSENIRRVAALCRQLNDAGKVVIAALISPYAVDRAMAREMIGAGRMVEVYMATSLAVCESRDPKGLYRRARAGTLPHFTGVSDPYEAPAQPELRFDTDGHAVADCVAGVFEWLAGG